MPSIESVSAFDDRRSSFSSFTTTSYTSYDSSSTIPGIGADSGKAIKRLGQVVVEGIDSIVVLRRLTQVEEHFKQAASDRNPGFPSMNRKEMCDDLLEFSRPVYPFLVRKRAFRIIMDKIGRMDFDDLAASFITLKSSEAYDHLYDVLQSLCCWNPVSSAGIQRDIDTTVKDRKLRLEYHRTGYEAYRGASPAIPTSNNSICLFASQFVLYLARIALLGSPKHSKLIAGLGILTFLHEHAFFGESRRSVISGYVLLRVLVLKLDGPRNINLRAMLESFLPFFILPAPGANPDRHPEGDIQLYNSLFCWTTRNKLSQASVMEQAVMEAIFYVKSFDKGSFEAVKTGYVAIKEGLLGDWKIEWLMLTDEMLVKQKSDSKNSSPTKKINLRDILNTEKLFKPEVLLLETKDEQYYISANSSTQLFDWEYNISTRVTKSRNGAHISDSGPLLKEPSEESLKECEQGMAIAAAFEKEVERTTTLREWISLKEHAMTCMDIRRQLTARIPTALGLNTTTGGAVHVQSDTNTDWLAIGSLLLTSLKLSNVLHRFTSLEIRTNAAAELPMHEVEESDDSDSMDGMNMRNWTIGVAI